MWAGNENKAVQYMNSIGYLQNVFICMSHIIEQKNSINKEKMKATWKSWLPKGTGVEDPMKHQQTRSFIH